jgi:predicted TPR repeat methyltransferase
MSLGRLDSMMRKALPLLLAGCPLLLGGCAAGLAASAIGAAAQSAQGTPRSNAHLAPAAEKACVERASQHGAVSVIDVQQRSTDSIRVWGTVEQAGVRRSFQCDYKTRITGFTLRAIARRR